MVYQKGSVTANVLVGFDGEAMSELFKTSSESYGDIESLVEGNPNLFLFGYGSPRNIVQMEHTYAQQASKSGGGASTFNIKFIDPEVEFENQFLKHSSMQSMALESFAIKKDPNKLKQIDIRKSPYGEWWRTKYDENFKAAKEADDATLKKRYIAWAPTAGGEQYYSGRKFYKTGDAPGEPSGEELRDGHYQDLENYGPWSAGQEKARWSRPVKLILSFSKPPYAPQKYYHKEETVDIKMVEEIQAQTTGEIIQAIKTQQSLMNAKKTAKIYVAYGMGYDFGAWAGPFVTTVMGASNNYDARGVRSLTVTLVANIGQLGEGARGGVLGAGFGKKTTVSHELFIKDFNAFGQGRMVSRSSDQVKKVVDAYKASFEQGFASRWVEEHTGVELSYGKDSKDLRPYLFLANHIPGDIHLIIKNAISKYICSVASQNDIPIGNIIVLMPDLTLGLKSLQENILTDILATNEVRKGGEAKLWENVNDGLWNNPEIDTKKEKNAVFGKKGLSSKVAKNVTMQTVWGFQVVKRLLEVLGFEFTISNNIGSKWARDDNPVSDEEKVRMIEGLAWAAYKEFDPYNDIGWDNKNTAWSDSLLHFFGDAAITTNQGRSRVMKKKFNLVITNRYDENQEETIFRVLNDISKNSSIGMTPTLQWETDLGILEELEKYGVIETATQPAIIFGDKRLVDKFVYGGLVFETIFNKEGSINDFLQYVHPSDQERFSWSDTANISEDGIPDRFASFIPKSAPKGEFLYCQVIFAKLYGISFGAFDKLFQLHSDEAFKELQQATAAGVPLFKSGYQNSNIISMKADLNPYWFSGLFLNNMATAGGSTGAGSGKIMKDDTKSLQNINVLERYGMSEEEMKRYLEVTTGGNLEALGTVSDILSTQVEEEFGFQIQTIEDYRDFINFVLGIQSGDNVSLPGSGGKGSKNIVPSENPKNPFVLVKEMIDSISQAYIEASIKTLPYFRLSGTNCLARPVMMLIRELQVAQTPYADRYSKARASAFSTKLYSGFWNLYGFKHVISNKEAYSEFTLFKQPGSSDPSYGNIDKLSDEMMSEAIEASLESENERIYTTDEIAAAKLKGGDISTNLIGDNIQNLNQTPRLQGEMGETK